MKKIKIEKLKSWKGNEKWIKNLNKIPKIGTGSHICKFMCTFAYFCTPLCDFPLTFEHFFDMKNIMNGAE